MESAVRRWAEALVRANAEVQAVGYFGAYARGDAGVGSDLDVVVVVDASDLPFERRAARYDTTPLPVGVDLLVYTQEEWQRMLLSGTRFGRTLQQETVWVFRRGDARDAP